MWFWQWWNWLWSEAGGAWVAALTTAVAIYFGWRASVKALRTAYRPVLRPVPSKDDSIGRIILKNQGNGPALSVVLLDVSNTVLCEVDVIEPLGPRPGGPTTEADRVGRRYVELKYGHLKHEQSYRLLYQDLGGRWHNTSFLFSQPDAPGKRAGEIPAEIHDVRYHGHVRNWPTKLSLPFSVEWTIPKSVRRMGHISTAD